MDLIICFIDDSDFEHDLVRYEIAPYAPELIILQAYTFNEARDLLGQRIPLLFLLDLWGRDMGIRRPRMMPKEEIEIRVSAFKTLDMVYDGLEDYPGDRNNEFLKRLFTIVDSWRNLFEETCNQIGQNGKYGLDNLRQAREYYPGVPAVFYTRKSLINDAVNMFRAGADGLLIKPTGTDDEKTRIITGEYAPTLLGTLADIIDSNLNDPARKENFYPDGISERGTTLEDLISSWKEFRNK